MSSSTSVSVNDKTFHIGVKCEGSLQVSDYEPEHNIHIINVPYNHRHSPWLWQRNARGWLLEMPHSAIHPSSHPSIVGTIPVLFSISSIEAPSIVVEWNSICNYDLFSGRTHQSTWTTRERRDKDFINIISPSPTTMSYLHSSRSFLHKSLRLWSTIFTINRRNPITTATFDISQ